MVHIQQTDPYKVQHIVTLGYEDDQKAKQMMQDIAQQVQPIMRRRKLKCPVLEEFFPSNPNLLGLNVNGGQGTTGKICLRLRPHFSPSSFFPYEACLRTMLHELSHNHIGPHNASFYHLMEEMVKECEELMAKGIKGAGVGFDAPPAGVAGGLRAYKSHPEHYHDIRSAAVKAAEERAKKQRVMSMGPQTLGSDYGNPLDWKSMTVAQAAAAAAQRRLADNVWCVSTLKEPASAAPSGAAGIAATQCVQPPQVVQANISRAAPAASGCKPLIAALRTAEAKAEPKNAVAMSAAVSPSATGTVCAASNELQYRADGGVAQLTEVQPRKRMLLQSVRTAEPPYADIIDLCASDDDSAVLGTEAAGSDGTCKEEPLAAAPARPEAPTETEQRVDHHSPLAMTWSCPVCTLQNVPLYLQCAACGLLKPDKWT